MITCCEGFIITLDKQLPPAVLLTAYELPTYGQHKIKGRPIIAAQDASQLPQLVELAIKAGLIDPTTYESEKTRLYKNHGLTI